jgi:Ricin-type beta-trefoil lectin domain
MRTREIIGFACGPGRRGSIALLLVAVVGLMVAAPVFATTPRSSQARRIEVYATYYGWYDNTPPGCATAYSGCAGGTGTFADPVTFASDRAEFPVGTILYSPTVRKYFKMGDDCQECDLDWSGHGPDGGPHLHHADLWIGGHGGNEFAAINCEDALTRARPNGAPLLTLFIEDPPNGLPVSVEPLFDTSTGRCFGGARAPSTTGSYRNQAANRCLADPSTRPGTPATLASCGRADTGRIVGEAAFLMQGDRCLQTRGSDAGATIVWARCDGDAREQWEINPNGTITWVQYTRCVTDERGRIMLAACRHSPAQRWAFRSAAS